MNITLEQLAHELRNKIPICTPTVEHLVSTHNMFVGKKRGTEIDTTDNIVLALIKTIADEIQEANDKMCAEYEAYESNNYNMDKPGFESSVSGGWLDSDDRFHLDF